MESNLFHYTDALAVKSIIENRELWLSDIRFLNDSQEMNDGVRYLQEELCSELPDVGLAVGHTIAAQDFLNDSFSDHVSLGIDDKPTFVCSFSEAGNQLSQWRAYGGYAIEFDREKIEGELDLFSCIYDHDTKKKLASEMVRDAIHGVAEDLVRFGGEPGEDSSIFLSSLVRTASVFKDESFYEEQEVRCAVDVAIPSPRVNFRCRGGVLIPYITASFSFDSIKAIHVGPMRDQELAYTSMRALVIMATQKAVNEGIERIPEIDVIMSKIPYRSPT